MSKLFSPFVCIIIYQIGYAIYAFAHNTEGRGNLVGLILLGIAVALLIIDVLMKIFMNPISKVWIIQGVILLIILLGYLYNHRIQALMIQPNYEHDYISIIYDIPDQPSLAIYPRTLTKKIPIPDNGIVLTSSSANSHLPKVQVKSVDDTQKLLYTQMSNNSLEIEGQPYRYRTRKINRNTQEGIGYSGTEASKYKKVLRDDLKQLLESLF